MILIVFNFAYIKIKCILIYSQLPIYTFSKYAAILALTFLFFIHPMKKVQYSIFL